MMMLRRLLAVSLTCISWVHASAKQTYSGYLMTYFTGEGFSNGEQVYFALSRGNDPLQWRTLNNEQPVLESQLGERGIRDPFAIRNPHTGGFHLIATDLKINGNWDWDTAQRQGSKDIVIWNSKDLVNWTPQVNRRVSPDTAGNTWAPEAFFDESIGSFVVYWASKLYSEDDPNHTGNAYNRMMFAVTPDFNSFGTAQVWIDSGYSQIDSTVIKNNGTYYRYTKDERNRGPDAPCGKHVWGDKSTVLTATADQWEVIRECIGADEIGAGEGPLAFESNSEPGKWYLFIDEFSGRGYVPFETTDLDSGEWSIPAGGWSMPPHPRHGSVLPITAEEYEGLLLAFGRELIVVDVKPVEEVVRRSSALELPTTVSALFADGEVRDVDVAWEESSFDGSKVGQYEIEGSVLSADVKSGVRVVANVRVV